MREEIATPLGVEDSFFMGGLKACDVETSRIAHVEHAFKIPGRSGTEFGQNGGDPSAATAGGASTQAASNGSGEARDGRKNAAATIGRKASRDAGDGDFVGVEGVNEVGLFSCVGILE